MKNGSKQDAELKSFLLRHDPAGTVDPRDSARLETFIADRIFCQPQMKISAVAVNDFFVIPPLLRGAFSWPASLSGAMMLGLILGLSSASFTDTTSTVEYNVAMLGTPWQHLMQEGKNYE